MSADILDPRVFVKRLVESGIATDASRIHMMEILPSSLYPKGTVMRVEYELDERFFEEPAKVPEVIIKINGTVTRETLEEMGREIEAALAAYHRKQGRSK